MALSRLFANATDIPGCCDNPGTCLSCTRAHKEFGVDEFGNECCCSMPWTTGIKFIRLYDSPEMCPNQEDDSSHLWEILAFVIGVILLCLVVTVTVKFWGKITRLWYRFPRRTDGQELMPNAEVYGTYELSTFL